MVNGVSKKVVFSSLRLSGVATKKKTVTAFNSLRVSFFFLVWDCRHFDREERKRKKEQGKKATRFLLLGQKSNNSN